MSDQLRVRRAIHRAMPPFM